MRGTEVPAGVVVWRERLLTRRGYDWSDLAIR